MCGGSKTLRADPISPVRFGATVIPTHPPTTSWRFTVGPISDDCLKVIVSSRGAPNEPRCFGAALTQTHLTVTPVTLHLPLLLFLGWLQLSALHLLSYSGDNNTDEKWSTLFTMYRVIVFLAHWCVTHMNNRFSKNWADHTSRWYLIRLMSSHELMHHPSQILTNLWWLAGFQYLAIFLFCFTRFNYNVESENNICASGRLKV